MKYVCSLQNSNNDYVFFKTLNCIAMTRDWGQVTFIYVEHTGIFRAGKERGYIETVATFNTCTKCTGRPGIIENLAGNHVFILQRLTFQTISAAFLCYLSFFDICSILVSFGKYDRYEERLKLYKFGMCAKIFCRIHRYEISKIHFESA